MMKKIDANKHCSLNKSIRNLFYKKQDINNSIYYTEEEKKVLTSQIEKDIYDTWKKIRYT
jgi:hypothetical protein